MNKGVYKIGKIDIIILIISLGFLSLWLFYSIKGAREQNKLAIEGVNDTAIIVRKFVGSRGYLNFEYVFNVLDKKCNGFLLINTSIGDISVGDTILIKYLLENPDDANEVVRNKDKSVVKVKSTQ
jgi:hypothetical protein